MEEIQRRRLGSGGKRLIHDAALADVCQALHLKHWLRGASECPNPKKLLEVSRAPWGRSPDILQ